MPTQHIIDIDTEAIARQLNATLDHPAMPFDQDAEATPGVYAIFYTGRHKLYRSSVRRLVYVGKTTSLRYRLRDHRRSLVAAKDLRIAEFSFLPIETLPAESGALCEDTLIKDLQPVWNQLAVSGFGSHPRGKHRRRQTPSPWDRLHPGRKWTSNTAATPCPELEAWVASYLAA